MDQELPKKGKSRYTPVQYAEAMRLHSEGLSSRAIARDLGVLDHKVITGWTSGKRRPWCMKPVEEYHNGFKPREGYEELSPAKGYLLGVICGDGSIHKSKSAWYVSMEVNDEDFLCAFEKALVDVYGAKPTRIVSKRNTFRVQVGSRAVCEDLNRYLKDRHKTENWVTPAEIMGGSAEVRRAFVRGFFDSEGGVTGGSSLQIAAWNTREDGLESVRAVLLSLGIDAKVYKCARCFCLAITAKSRVKYVQEIGFSIVRKQRAAEGRE